MVITAARVIEVDFRTMPVQNTQGTAFMCCFGSRRCLMGYKNTLWIMVADLHMIEPADTRSMHRRNLVVRFDGSTGNGGAVIQREGGVFLDERESVHVAKLAIAIALLVLARVVAAGEA